MQISPINFCELFRNLHFFIRFFFEKNESPTLLFVNFGMQIELSRELNIWRKAVHLYEIFDSRESENQQKLIEYYTLLSKIIWGKRGAEISLLALFCPISSGCVSITIAMVVAGYFAPRVGHICLLFGPRSWYLDQR